MHSKLFSSQFQESDPQRSDLLLLILGEAPEPSEAADDRRSTGIARTHPDREFFGEGRLAREKGLPDDSRKVAAT